MGEGPRQLLLPSKIIFKASRVFMPVRWPQTSIVLGMKLKSDHSKNAEFRDGGLNQ